MKLTNETHKNFPTLESLVGTTWRYISYDGSLKYILKVTGVGVFEWIIYEGEIVHRYIGKNQKLYAPSALRSYRRVITTPEDPHAETDF